MQQSPISGLLHSWFQCKQALCSHWSSGWVRVELWLNSAGWSLPRGQQNEGCWDVINLKPRGQSGWRLGCKLLWSTNMLTICFVAFASFALIEHTKLTTVIVRVTELEVTTAWDTSINYRMCFFSPVYGSKVCPWSRWALSKLWLFFPIWWEQLFEQMQWFIAQKSQLASDGLHLEFIDYKVLGFWRVSCSFLFSSFLRMCCTLEG